MTTLEAESLFRGTQYSRLAHPGDRTILLLHEDLSGVSGDEHAVKARALCLNGAFGVVEVVGRELDGRDVLASPWWIGEWLMDRKPPGDLADYELIVRSPEGGEAQFFAVHLDVVDRFRDESV